MVAAAVAVDGLCVIFDVCVCVVCVCIEIEMTSRFTVIVKHESGGGRSGG